MKILLLTIVVVIIASTAGYGIGFNKGMQSVADIVEYDFSEALGISEKSFEEKACITTSWFLNREREKFGRDGIERFLPHVESCRELGIELEADYDVPERYLRTQCTLAEATVGFQRYRCIGDDKWFYWVKL